MVLTLFFVLFSVMMGLFIAILRAGVLDLEQRKLDVLQKAGWLDLLDRGVQFMLCQFRGTRLDAWRLSGKLYAKT